MQPDWSYTFAAAKGPKGLTILARPYFDRMVMALPDGQECVLTLAPKVDKRTGKQNRTLWGVVYESLLNQIAGEVGYDRHDRCGKEQLHEGLLMLFGGVKVCPITKREVAAKRSSKMSKAEFAEYVDWIARWAATEYQIVVELPSDVEAA